MNYIETTLSTEALENEYKRYIRLAQINAGKYDEKRYFLYQARLVRAEIDRRKKEKMEG